MHENALLDQISMASVPWERARCLFFKRTPKSIFLEKGHHQLQGKLEGIRETGLWAVLFVIFTS